MSYKKQTIVTALLFGVLSVLGALTTDADAAASTTYTLDGGGMQFMRSDGTSTTYDVQGRMFWHAENMESTTYELTSESPSGEENGGTSGGTSGGSTGGSSGGTSGGSDTANAPSGGGRRTTPPTIPGESAPLPVVRTRRPIGRPAAPADETTSTRVTDDTGTATMDTIDETSPTSADANATDAQTVDGRPVIRTTTTRDGTASDGVVDAIRSSAVTKTAITAAQAVTVVRLGYIYRFESLYEALPAYRMGSTAAIRTLSLAVRPGSIAIDSLLWPFAWLGKLKRRKRRSDDESDHAF